MIQAIAQAFPLSAVLDGEVVRSVSDGLARVAGVTPGRSIRESLAAVRPSWAGVPFSELRGRLLLLEVVNRPEVRLRAQLVLSEGSTVLLCNPLLSRFEDRDRLGFSMEDFGPMDATPDLVLGAQSQAQTVSQLEKVVADLREVSKTLVARNAELARALNARQKAEEKLVQAQKLEMLGQLAGGITHDFNNLGVAILGYTEVGLEETRDVAAREALEGVRDAAQRASELTRRLLAFARKNPTSPERAEVVSEIRGIRRLLDRLIGGKIQIELDLSTKALFTDLDRTGIEQIVMNLAVNARDAMPEGGTLWISAREIGVVGEVAAEKGISPGRYVVLTVADTGCGMPPEVRARIFEPFYTTKGVGRGTGLGLSTVYGLVQGAHGVMNVRSKPGEGTTFEIMLPRRKQKGGQTLPTAQAAREILRGACVLVVDDERQVRQVVSRILERAGCRVVQAETPQDALTSLGKNVEIALVDVNLGASSGVDLAAALLARRPDLGVALMSGGAYDPRLQAGLKAGLYRLLPKPFETDRLLSVLGAIRSGADPSTSDLALFHAS